MIRVALVLVLAVLLPSAVLAWLAVQSLRDQELVFERQQEMLLQGTADSIAERIRGFLAGKLREFETQVNDFANSPDKILALFDERIRTSWPMAEVGFAVTLDGRLLAPKLEGDAAARRFIRENRRFLTNAETAEVYQQQTAVPAPADQPKQKTESGVTHAPAPPSKSSAARSQVPNEIDRQTKDRTPEAQPVPGALSKEQAMPSKQLDEIEPKKSQAAGQLTQPQKIIVRSVNPQRELKESDTAVSNVLPAEADFRQLVGSGTSGSVARFVQNELSVLFWHRTPADPQTVFGAQVNLANLTRELDRLIVPNYDLAKTVCVALLDDTGKPVARTDPAFKTNWKRPFVATEIGEILPHWEIGLYLLNPAAVNQTAATVRRTVGLIIGLMLFVIGTGGWLICRDIGRQVRLARQKTDFVSNVSHELKTPLTSIRMFSELLADGTVQDSAKQKRYSEIIASEASRLTRLINNVLDFARMERAEKKYERRASNLNEIVAETVAHYRPHFEANGIELSLTREPLQVVVDRDAIAQVLLNLLSNAEKYGQGPITVSSARAEDGVASIDVCDRGPGVPHGAAKKIFEQFYRVHDSLSSGIQGAGLGLTLARQIARAHGGDVVYKPREGGGSRFSVLLPVVKDQDTF